MRRSEVVEKLEQQATALRSRFRVRQLSLFGSHARDDARESSDVDVLVEFEGAATFDGYMELKFFLEDLLGSPVDLVTSKAVRPELRSHIEKDAIRVT